MSTFERVKRNIVKDMERSKVHTAMSWANILLQRTARLTDIEEQKKFWEWIENPEEEERLIPSKYTNVTHKPLLIPSHVRALSVLENSDDEKENEIELHQETVREGFTTYIKVTPL